MTDRIAIFLGAIILAVLAYDFLANQGAIAFFLALKFLDLVEYLAFWR
jgi:hypothetical protein